VPVHIKANTLSTYKTKQKQLCIFSSQVTEVILSNYKKEKMAYESTQRKWPILVYLLAA
jgi:hypothetical protein